MARLLNECSCWDMTLELADLTATPVRSRALVRATFAYSGECSADH